MQIEEEEKNDWIDVDFLCGVDETENFGGQLIPNEAFDLASSISARKFLEKNKV